MKIRYSKGFTISVEFLFHNWAFFVENVDLCIYLLIPYSNYTIYFILNKRDNNVTFRLICIHNMMMQEMMTCWVSQVSTITLTLCIWSIFFKTKTITFNYSNTTRILENTSVDGTTHAPLDRHVTCQPHALSITGLAVLVCHYICEPKI